MAPSNMPTRFAPGNGREIQPAIPFIAHALDGEIIEIRHRDGYVNATAMCKAAGRAFGGYRRLDSTEAFLTELSAVVHIHTTELIQSVTGGIPEQQGSWVHPRVAIHLAQWLSPRFAVQVTEWVHDWISNSAKQAARTLPFHLRRYVANHANVPEGHFSVLTEMVFNLIAPLDIAGYELPETLWPDISEGVLWARYLREVCGLDTDTFPTYWHVFEDGRPPVRAKAYPNELLALFRGHFATVWLRQRARAYFLERDPTALPYIDIALPAAREPGMLPFDAGNIPICRPAQRVVSKPRPWFKRR